MSQVKINHYFFNKDEVLGKGSTGTVYLGVDTRNNKKVAVKTIELKNITNEVTKYLLENEVKALQVTNHPNVLKAYDVVYDSDCCYVVTNYCPNDTLQHYIKSRGRIPEEEAIKIFKQIVDGYLNLHVNRILHRDLKPSNILFSESFQPVICDFGYCEIADYLPKPKLHYNVGSPAYMAPESITKNMYSESSEVWSLGTILYEMIQGKSFAHGKEVMEAIMQIKKKGPYSPDGASQFSKNIIKKCMALHPNDRMRLKDLVTALRSGQLQNSLTSRPSPTVKSSYEGRPATYSIPHSNQNENHLQNLHLAQQQLLQPIVNQSIRRTVPTTKMEQLTKFPTARNTMPVELSNATRARSTQPVSPEQFISQLPPGTRLSTQPSQVKRQPTMPNQHMTHSFQQPQIIIGAGQQVIRPSTTRLPFRPFSNFNLEQSWENPAGIRSQIPHMIDRTFVNPEDLIDQQILQNASFQTQPVYSNKVEERSTMAPFIARGPGFAREEVVNRNTIQNINATILNHQQSVRKLNDQQIMLISQRSNSSSLSQEGLLQQYQSEQRDEFARRFAQEQHHVRQTSSYNPQTRQIQVQQIQDPRNIQQLVPAQIQQIHPSPQSPFLKTPASKIYAPVSQFPQGEHLRNQNIQMNQANLIQQISKRKHPSNIPQSMIQQFPPRQIQHLKQIPQRIVNNGVYNVQRPISVVSRRIQ